MHNATRDLNVLVGTGLLLAGPLAGAAMLALILWPLKIYPPIGLPSPGIWLPGLTRHAPYRWW